MKRRYYYPGTLLVLVVSISIATWRLAALTENAPFQIPADWTLYNKNRTFLVTGANSGLGYATVKHLLDMGTASSVIMACRNEQRCETAREDILATRTTPTATTTTTSSLTMVQLDLSSLQSIQDCAESIKQAATTNLTVILNAGVIGETHGLCSKNGVEHHMMINHLGHFYLTHLLFEKVERVVIVSSMAAMFPLSVLQGADERDESTSEGSSFVHALQGFLCYFRSKRANLLFASELHKRYGMLQIKIIASHPGYSRSRIMLTGMSWAPKWIRRFLHINPFMSMSCAYGALSQVRAALEPTLNSLSYVGPRYALFGPPVILGTADSSWHHWRLSRKEAVELWDWSLQKLNITEFGQNKMDIHG
jgi:NAD(P)-dependent dehydrogenase (short-subunit alcohol dehydrogenase family)